MVETKLFEIRDRGTCIPAIAVCLSPYTTIDAPHFPTLEETRLIRHAGFGDPRHIMLGRMEGGHFAYDPYRQPKDRTMHHAHIYIADNWESLNSGDVIDVEFILGERATKKASEMRDF